MKLSTILITALSAVQQAHSLTSAQWRSQSIYQIVTDRFARTDGSTTASCNINNYCGGSWQGIINKLDYIQGMGFTAVRSILTTLLLRLTFQIWISPVVENLPQSTGDGESYHGYWAQNIYALNANFGSASDLRALSSALHQRGMVRKYSDGLPSLTFLFQYLMVDVVTNHSELSRPVLMKFLRVFSGICWVRHLR